MSTKPTKKLKVFGLDLLQGPKGDPGKDAPPISVDNAMSDSSTNPVQNKVAKAYVDGVKIGGRNYIKNSKISETSSNPGFARREAVSVEPNTDYIFSINGRTNANGSNKQLLVQIYENNNPSKTTKSIYITSESDATYSISVTSSSTIDTFIVASYYYPNDGITTGNATVNWYKLEKGTKPSDWSPAIEDFDDKVAAIKIGGRNLLQKEFFFKAPFVNTVETVYLNKTCLQLSHAGVYENGGSSNLFPTLTFETNTQYTFQVEITNTASEHKGMAFIFEYVDGTTVQVTEFGGDGSYRYFKYTSDAGKTLLKIKGIYWNTGITYIANIKLEKGNNPTDWTPAPEDMYNKIKALEDRIAALEA